MPYAIEMEDVSRHFGSVKAVSDMTMQVPAGLTFGLIGPNGSGKTTLIRMVAGLISPTRGRLRVLGRHPGERTVAIRTGYMPQADALYRDLPVRENLNFFATLYGVPRAARKARIEEVLALVEMLEYANRPVETLSGGMKQRVPLACALVHSPELVLLDEPTVGVDPELRRTFWNYFRTLASQGVTVVVSTHHLDEAGRCDQLALMRGGRLLAMDTPAALLQRSGQPDLESAFLHFAGVTNHA